MPHGRHHPQRDRFGQQRRRLLAALLCLLVKQLLEQEFSTDVLFKGGLTVKTTIDPRCSRWQGCRPRAARHALARRPGHGMVVVDPRAGYIKCMVGGYD